jgi:hypothetical protein
MKKPFLIFLSVLLAAVSYGGLVSFWANSSVVAATSTVKLYVNPASAGVTTGYTTALQLRLYKNSSAKVDYVDARVTFSAAQLEVVSISKQGSYFNSGGGPSVAYNNSNGTISVTGNGAPLATIDDVLLATVTFKAKTAGSGSVTFTAASQAGDITNGGHVKNSLDTRVGGVVNITNPVSSGGSSGGGTPAPTNPVAPVAPVPSADPATPAPATEEPQTSGAPSDQSQANGSPSQSDDVSTAIERTVTSPPAWLQLLLPIAGVVATLGMLGLGYVLFLKRKQGGVTLPPEDEATDAETMPTTETIAQADSAAFATFQGDEATDDSTGFMQEPELPEFNSTLDTPQPMADTTPPSSDLASVLSQPVELMPEELMAVPDVAQSAPEEPIETSATEVLQQDILTEPVEQPASSESVVQPPTVGEFAAQVPDAPVLQSAAITVPVQPPVAPLMDEPAAMPMPPPIANEVYPVQPEVAPSVAEQPVPAEQLAPPAQPESLPQAPVMSAQADPNEPIDYKNMPDMFDVGEQRLQNEGFAKPTPPPARTQPV